MTVRELIKKLEKMPQDIEVVVSDISDSHDEFMYIDCGASVICINTSFSGCLISGNETKVCHIS